MSVATMRQGAAGQAAREPVEAGHLSSREVLDNLRSLPSLWADAGPEGRHALATPRSARQSGAHTPQTSTQWGPHEAEEGGSSDLGGGHRRIRLP